MKKRYLSVLGLAALLSFSSCGEDFLYKGPQGAVDEEALTNAQGVDLLTTNAYATLTENGWGASVFNWTFGGMYGGDANKGSDNGDQAVLNTMETYSLDASNDYVNEKFEWVYKGAKRVNFALQVIANVENMDEATKNSRIGELKFLRALCYFEGIKVFGPMIPWVDDTYKENDPKVHNDKDIYPMVLADLDDAIAKLPATQPVVGRVNSWAAKSLKARVLMQQGKMAEAKPILADVLANGVTSNGLKYGLEDKLDNNWNIATENGKESIFAVQHSVDANDNGNAGMSLCYPHGGAGAPGGCCGFYQPSAELANSFKVTAEGLPMLDNSYRNAPYVDEAVKGSDEAYSKVTDVAVDPRLDFTLGRFGVPYKDWGEPKLNWVRDVANGGFYIPRKHVYYKADEQAGMASGGFSAGWAPGSAMNIQYLSVRDMVLLYAECLADAGDLRGAMEQVNKIRKRAANKANITENNGKPAANYKIAEYPSSHAAFSSKDECVKAVRMERKLELAMEGLRWFDLSRWGGKYMAATLKDYVTFESKFIAKFSTSSYIKEERTMFPLPDRQVLTMGNDENGQPYLVQPAPWK